MNRRSFLQKTSLLTTTLFVSLNADAFAFLNNDKKISGKVISKGKGVANVIISDGYSVIQSDKNGNYTIDVNELARFIWISTPSGYEFKTESSIARHYYKPDTAGKLNFDLKPLNQQDDKHSFIIWADPQVKNKKDVEQMMATSVPDTIEAVKSLGNVPIHGIGVGDLVWDNFDLFPAYDEAIAKIGIPFFQAIGNHDQDYRQGGDETSDRTFQAHYGPTYYSFNRGKAHYVVLDDVRYLGTEREYDGFITQTQLDWLAKDLRYVSKDALLILCLHIPVHNQVKNREDFYAVFKEFKNVHIMSGHTHYNKNVITNGVFEHNHGTVCGGWWTGPICEDGTPRGYGVYEVNGTDLKWHYKSTGRNRREQLDIYVDELTNQKRLIANVWNYDPEWKVEYFLDDKPMGAMLQQTGLDPLAVKIYKGDKLPNPRPFVEPRSTDHLFIAQFEPSVKKVKVIATDRFGEKFEADYQS
ncbi:calcineurin-like phosphoesterase C-terminal domain-containing protein [Pedobacter mucosus]|uniref:calcineurin-like phosphoesterase C-terminal domain-containing protein n=1 Tax=Pedobacter mucosus TaxID=2895286 RepID=UPI001EE402BE|nr:calcineurin-like phosphoesterase family protein [Pedobacter mucosus]UKT65547.1 calcineurin-like phosphoesterase family protein [Pedobacter mucosus]